MKKLMSVLIILLGMTSSVFANTVGNAAKNFVDNASSMGNGTSYLGVQYDVSRNIFSGVAQFGLLGPWGCEIGVSFGEDISVDLDIMSFLWSIYFSDKVFINLGIGGPINMYFTAGFAEDFFGWSPHVKVELNFVGENGYGVVIYARPGCKIGNLSNGFSMPIGVGFRMPGDVLASMF